MCSVVSDDPLQSQNVYAIINTVLYNPVTIMRYLVFGGAAVVLQDLSLLET